MENVTSLHAKIPVVNGYKQCTTLFAVYTTNSHLNCIDSLCYCFSSTPLCKHISDTFDNPKSFVQLT